MNCEIKVTGRVASKETTSSGKHKVRLAVNKSRKDQNGEWQKDTQWFTCYSPFLLEKAVVGEKITVIGDFWQHEYEHNGVRRVDPRIFVTGVFYSHSSESEFPTSESGLPACENYAGPVRNVEADDDDIPF